jgi:hypothetical protein
MSVSKSITISSPKGLTPDEWTAISGSNLHTTMVKNRSFVEAGSSGTTRSKVYAMICDFLKEQCKTAYYIANKSPIAVYVEGDADMINFVMAFNGQDLPEDEPVMQAPPTPTASQIQTLLQQQKAQEIMNIVKQRMMEEQYLKEQEHYRQATSDKMSETLWNDLYQQKWTDDNKYTALSQVKPRLRY